VSNLQNLLLIAYYLEAEYFTTYVVDEPSTLISSREIKFAYDHLVFIINQAQFKTQSPHDRTNYLKHTDNTTYYMSFFSDNNRFDNSIIGKITPSILFKHISYAIWIYIQFSRRNCLRKARKMGQIDTR